MYSLHQHAETEIFLPQACVGTIHLGAINSETICSSFLIIAYLEPAPQKQ